MSLPWAEPFAAALALRHEPGLVLLESMPGSRWAAGPISRRVPPRSRRTACARVERLGEAWWAGWLSHDLGREIERVPVRAADDLGLPPLALGRYEAWLEWDHDDRTVQIRGDGDASHLLRALAHPAPRRAGARAADRLGELSPAARYEQAVRRAIDYIRAGDVFQVNLSQRLGTDWDGDPFALYGRLRRHESRRRSWRSCGSAART